MKKMVNYLFDVSLVCLIYIVTVLIYTSVLLIFNTEISAWNIPVATFISIVIYCCYRRSCGWNIKSILLVLILGFIIVVLSSSACSVVLDRSSDGNWYHKIAIGLLKNGWNPIYQSVEEFRMNHKELAQMATTSDIYIEGYAKGVWIFAACFYALTGNIESGKCLTAILIVVLFLMALDYFWKRWNNIKTAVLMSLVISLTTVTISQILSYYVDGILACTFYITLLALIELSDVRCIREKKDIFFMMACAIIICGNVKFTGLVYVGVFCILWYCMWAVLLFIKRENERLRKLGHVLIYYLAVLVITVGIVGSNSYVINTIRHQNPVYPIPLMSSEKNFVEIYDIPVELRTNNNLQIFVKLLFSKTSNVTAEVPVEYKIPFTFERSELLMGHTDTRRAGFGVFFSGLFLVSIAIILFYLKRYIKSRDLLVTQVFIGIFGSLILVSFVSGGFLARYSPYVYVCVPTALFLIFDNIKEEKKVLKVIFTGMFVFCIGINALTAIGSPGQAILQTVWCADDLKKMEEASETEICFYDVYRGALFNLQDRGINYQVVEELKDGKRVEACRFLYKTYTEE